MQVATTPAPTQGPLLAQTVSAYLQLATEADSLRKSPSIHLLSEVVNQVYGWRLKHLGDPDFVNVPDPLDQSSLDALKAGVNRDNRSEPLALGRYNQGDTSQFSLIDAEGNGVSWIQSLGLGFGSGIAVSELGLFIGDRLGRSATLDQTEPNSVAPWKRPVNTIHTWGASSMGRLRWMGGTPGGDGQVQWNAQTLISLLFEQTTPLEALSRPKWTYYPGVDKAEADMIPQLRVDDTLPDEDVDELSRRGHNLVVTASVGGVSRLVGRSDSSAYGLDDGRHEGLTAAI
jgi:gamma-glutamyltranspeptidase/glutathione hydrolase